MNPRNSIDVRTGTEGPPHDPYHFDEVTLDCRAGKVQVHLGLAEWLRVNGKMTMQGDGCYAEFERITGISPGRAMEIKSESGWRRHAVQCPERRRFECVGGMPGESLTVCGRCGDVVDYSFNRSAVE